MSTNAKTGNIILLAMTVILLVIVTLQANEIRQLKRGLDGLKADGKLVSQYERNNRPE
jgi:hypothetical protein